jgi:zinc D-Ala-D-Ala carboxypeptidase
MSMITDQSAFEAGHNKWPNFSYKELACQHTGTMNLSEDFLIALQELRDAYGKAMTITSGYRSPEHPIEAKKSSPGYHSKGAIDVAVSGEDAVQLLTVALNLGWTGIGINVPSFIHLDRREQPTIWKY